MKNYTLLLGILCFITLSVCAEPRVTFAPEQARVEAGDIFTVSVVGADLPLVEGGGVSLHFDSSLINVLNVTVDAGTWEFVSRNGAINNLDGQVSDILFSSYSGKSGIVQIATIQLQAINHGKGTLVLSEASANPFASQGNRVPVKFGEFNVTVKGGRGNDKGGKGKGKGQ